nr:hypothetical protein [Tanacetum cinerariifolium]
MIFDGLVKNVNNKVSKFLMYPRFLTMCLRMSQFGQITHTQTYVVPFHTKKLFTTLRVNSPSFSGRTVPLFAAMLVHQGDGSGTPTEPHQTPSPEAQTPSHTTHLSSSLPPITTTSIPTVTPIETTLIGDVSQREACPTDSDFIADQDRVTIDKSSTLPHDSAPRVTSPAAVEGSMQETIPELTALCTSLQRQLFELNDKFQAQEVEINRLKERVKQLEEREGVAAINSGDDAPIKGRSMDEGEAATERVTTVLASGVVNVPTGSGSIPTASTPAERSVLTGSEEVPTAITRRKGKEVMVESKTPKKQKVQEQIDAQVTRELKEQLKSSEDITEGAKSPEEVPEEKVKEMMNLVPIEEVYVEALQVKHPIIDWENFMHAPVDWKLYDSCGVHHVAVKDKEIFMLVEKDYPLRKGLALVMICYKLQVENFSQMVNELVLKIYKIANSPR